MKIYRYGEVGSTQKIAKKLAENGVEEGTVVIADLQKEGRGRLDRKWVSPFGGLYFSVILKMDARLPLISAVAVAKTLKKFGLDAKIKWPNDILIKNKKIAGILIECFNDHAVLGMGINVDKTPLETATSIKDERKNISRETLLNQILENLHFYKSKENVLDEYKKLSDTIGKFVRIRMVGGDIEGKAVGIDESGRLILEREGKLEKIISGDCIYLR